MSWALGLMLVGGLGYISGVGEVTIDTVANADLTSDEQSYGNDLLRKFRALCQAQGEVCDRPAIESIIIALNARRQVVSLMLPSIVRSEVWYECSAAQPDAEVACLKRFSTKTYEEMMQALGYRFSGVTMRGYSQLRMGMSLDDVEFILGPGVEASYVGGYGTSVSMYSWKRGMANIIVSFRDERVSGRSQIGLR